MTLLKTTSEAIRSIDRVRALHALNRPLPLNTKLKELDTEKQRLAAELDAAPDEKPLLHPALAVTYRDRAAALATALYDEKDESKYSLHFAGAVHRECTQCQTPEKTSGDCSGRTKQEQGCDIARPSLEAAPVRRIHERACIH